MMVGHSVWKKVCAMLTRRRVIYIVLVIGLLFLCRSTGEYDWGFTRFYAIAPEKYIVFNEKNWCIEEISKWGDVENILVMNSIFNISNVVEIGDDRIFIGNNDDGSYIMSYSVDRKKVSILGKLYTENIGTMKKSIPVWRLVKLQDKLFVVGGYWVLANHGYITYISHYNIPNSILEEGYNIIQPDIKVNNYDFDYDFWKIKNKTIYDDGRGYKVYYAPKEKRYIDTLGNIVIQDEENLISDDQVFDPISIFNNRYWLMGRQARVVGIKGEHLIAKSDVLYDAKEHVLIYLPYSLFKNKTIINIS
ncbi:hypothetical protein [uncultured Veillonella sp.]|uniref:hypothetical protein n=1 Tax=uncultured Veillonella sp. TaxID=159268 RepID=UPI00259803D6|nr:hypothetical protein [uncultured Veillonella sp.]